MNPIQKPPLLIVTPRLAPTGGTEIGLHQELPILAQSFDIVIGTADTWDGPLPAGVRVERLGYERAPGVMDFMAWMRTADRWIADKHRDKGETFVYSPGINCSSAHAMTVHVSFSDLPAAMRAARTFIPFRTLSGPRAWNRRATGIVLRGLESQQYSRGDVGLIAVSKRLSQQLRQRWGRSVPPPTLPHTVDGQRFSPQMRQRLRGIARSELGLSDSAQVILMIGNDWTLKGFHFFLHVLRTLPPSVKLLAISGDKSHLFIRHVFDWDLGGRVTIVRPRADVETFYAAADAFVAPTFEDSFGLPVLEAAACGLPLLVSGCAGAAEWFRADLPQAVIEARPEVERWTQPVAHLIGGKSSSDGAALRQIALAVGPKSGIADHLRASPHGRLLGG